MADLSQVREHMEIVGADGAHVGTVDNVSGDRIKMTKQDSGSGSHKGHHHYISGGLVAAVSGNTVRLSANADAAILLEEEKSGTGIFDSGSTLRKVAIGAAAAAGVAAAGAFIFSRRSGSSTDATGGETEVDIVFVPDETVGTAPTGTAPTNVATAPSGSVSTKV